MPKTPIKNPAGEPAALLNETPRADQELGIQTVWPKNRRSLITCLDPEWCYKKTGREVLDHVMWKPRELIETYGEELTTEEIDLCIFPLPETPIRPYQYPAKERCGMHAAKHIPHRLEPRHWEYLTETHPSDMLWHHPEKIPESRFQTCLDKSSMLTLSQIADRLPVKQLEDTIQKDTEGTQFLLKKPQQTPGKLNGLKLARRILETPGLDLPEEITSLAHLLLAESI